MDKDLENDIQRVPIVNKIELEPNLTLEVANKWEVAVTLLTFLGIAALSILVGCFGPPLEIKEKTKNILDMHENSAWSRFYMNFTNLKPTNKYQRFYIIFRRQSLGGQISAPVTANFTVTYFRKNMAIRYEAYKNIKYTVKSSKIQLDSTPFVFLRENKIDYDVLLLNSSFEIFTRAYQFSTFVWEYGCSLHEKMILFIRMTYALVEILFFIMMLSRLNKFSKDAWRPEQKFTLYLLLFSILCNNPFELVNQFYPSSFFHFIDILFSSIFKSYLLFFILIIFDLTKNRNLQIDSKFYTPKIYFYGLYGIFLFVSKSINEFYSLSENAINIIDYINAFFILISVAWTISLIRVIMQKTDYTEQFIFYLYIGSIFLSILIIGIGRVMLDANPLLKNKLLNSLLTHAVLNMLVLFMAEVHFPALPDEEILFNEANSDEILEIENMINEEELMSDAENKMINEEEHASDAENKMFNDINDNQEENK